MPFKIRVQTIWAHNSAFYLRKRSIYHFLKFLVLSGSDSDNEDMEEEEEGEDYKEEKEKVKRRGSHRRKRKWIEAEVVMSESDIGWNSTAKRKRMDRTKRDIDWALNPNNYYQIM